MAINNKKEKEGGLRSQTSLAKISGSHQVVRIAQDIGSSALQECVGAVDRIPADRTLAQLALERAIKAFGLPDITLDVRDDARVGATDLSDITAELAEHAIKFAQLLLYQTDYFRIIASKLL